ncbi:uncharacterized protein I206_106444 [Kwoniella pini CBS 10737]|uniref:NADH:ubiquinone oxidoreductase intermediate-associated protein 30 domain-containing protein n=1 Tax=Kwoniella pini CBS 10737 TaxID=1296096 RepID=A0A1B9HUB5_9TREE|nr:uncharacterized protein I206_07248 [Kwoniella pini CBS 10737]OCF46861.1 hypothetical protein I206_07248 [Kwoniella pini CBS 10737]
MTTPLKSYLGRSIDLLRRNTARIVQSEPTPRAHPTTIFSFDSTNPPVDKIDQFGLGSDIEVGGLSTCSLSLIPSLASSSSNAHPKNETVEDGEDKEQYSHMSFYGYLSTKIPQAKIGQIRTGYAGFRNTSKPTLFGQDTWDLELYSHLKIVVGYRGWEGWRNRWVVNIGIDGRPKSDVFQHRLELPPSDNSTSSKIPLDPFNFQTNPQSFSTLYLPLSSFVLIKKGVISPSSIPLPKSSIRTIGFALLGRDRGDDGPSKPSPLLSSEGSKGILGNFNLGGWGKSTLSKEEIENDQELRSLIEKDSPNQVSEPIRRSSASSPSTGGYHRVGATEASPSTNTSGESTSTLNSVSQGQDDREGYFELDIKSVEAVKWDPEMDGIEGEA